MLESPTLDAMAAFLNSNYSEWLHILMLEVDMKDFGAYALQDEGRVRGIRQGNLQLADSGMEFVGRRKPNYGHRNAFNVMQDGLGFVLFGVDAHVIGGAGPKPWRQALNRRDIAIDKSCPVNCPHIVKIPLQGRSLVAEQLKERYRILCTPDYQLH